MAGTTGKALTNPISSGGGGPRFEACIQAKFVTLMLSGGFSPCLPPWPIKEIKLQGKVAGYDTDDLIVIIENPVNNELRKLLGQVKHSISMTSKSSLFAEVIQAAWNDFNNADIFKKNRDVIALITGPISSTDMEGVSHLLEQARHSKDDKEFFAKISTAIFCSDNVRKKLQAFREHLNKANGNQPVADIQVHDFLRHFHYLGYDLDRKSGVISSLLQSHISQFNKDMPAKIWSQIICEVQDFNQMAGTITRSNISEEILNFFRKPSLTYIPSDFVTTEVRKTKYWSSHENGKDLFLLNMIGAWDENNKHDRELIKEILDTDIDTWILSLRKLSIIPSPPVQFKRGIWKIKERTSCFEDLYDFLFEDQITRFCSGFLIAFNKIDKAIKLDEDVSGFRFGLDNELLYSDALRNGLSETFALLGSRLSDFKNCKPYEVQHSLNEALEQLLAKSGWKHWATMDRFMPNLAEGAPEKFLNVLTEKRENEPELFAELLKEYNTGFSPIKYCLGLIGALETLAWEGVFFVRAIIFLSWLAERDSTSKIANNPFNSLKEIFLPWRPHTLATKSKRLAGLKLLFKDFDDVAWTLALSLLPNIMTTSTGTREPKWWIMPEGKWEPTVTNRIYWETCEVAASEAIRHINGSTKRYLNLIDNFASIPEPQSEQFLLILGNIVPEELSDEEKNKIWDALLKFSTRHKNYPEANWSLSPEQLHPIIDLIPRFKPQDKMIVYRKFFTDDVFSMHSRKDWDEFEKEQSEKQNAAIADLYAIGGLDKIIDFAKSIDRNYLVGISLSILGNEDLDFQIISMLPDFEGDKIYPFLSSYVLGRKNTLGWEWFDSLDKSKLRKNEEAYVLSCFPFTDEVWDRLNSNNESTYWKIARPNFHQKITDCNLPLRKLLRHNRPGAVINAINQCIFTNKVVDADIVVEALLKYTGKNDDENIDNVPDVYAIKKIISLIQENNTIPQETKLAIEWKYLSLLDQFSEIKPTSLFKEMSADPNFYKQIISLIYRPRDTVSDDKEQVTEEEKNMAVNAYRLLSNWDLVPGTDANGIFNSVQFEKWFDELKTLVLDSGQHDMALYHLGNALMSPPSDPCGLWIHTAIAEVLDHPDMDRLREGYRISILNSRGAHFVDPEAKEELALTQKYLKLASEVEDYGYLRLSGTLMSISNMYAEEARSRLQDRTLE
ncbi:hypothetical protein F3J37_21485 [Pantoea sp. Al-1710]|uniref:Uncharacterized protein n=1 Tax=Candidatus Pantoea communis TaxID=2608354 RepID=A0ABX0RUX1_9GAMM|nr:hypothetical protein [Pantoea communis]NIG21252.1 hypothetical protein [Pantoea communis]